MSRSDRQPQISLVVVCSGAVGPTARRAAREIVARVRQAGLPCTAAVDEASLSEIAPQLRTAGPTIEIAPIMPLANEAPSLESRIEACRAAAGAVAAVYLPAEASLHGVHADLMRLGMVAVIDAAAGSLRRALPVRATRLPVDALVPGTTWWSRLRGVDVEKMAARAASTSIAIDAAALASGGMMARRQASRLIQCLEQGRAAGDFKLDTASEVAEGLRAVRRPAPQQSILRAA